MNYLLRGILSKQWAIDPRFVQAHLPFIQAILSGDANAWPDSIKASSVYVVSASTGKRNKRSLDQSEQGSIAVIDLQGPLMKHDQECGPVGTATISQWIKQADSNPNIIGTIICGDTPGGTVDGTEELARVINATKKPTIGFIDGLCASAGYWAMSQCDKLIASGKTSTIGSIGVMSRWTDWTAALEAEGIKVTEAYARKSTEKNYVQRALAEGNIDPLLDELDALNEVFIGAVTKGRKHATLKEDVFTGKHYLSAAAKRMGLVDSIGTMDDAIREVKKLSNNMSNVTTAAEFPLVTTALGWNGFESTDDGVYMSIEEVGVLEAGLGAAATANAEVTRLLAVIEDNLAERATIEASLAAVTTQRDALQTTVAEMGSRRATNGTKVAAGAEAEEKAPPVKTGYVPDGTEKLAEKYKMYTGNWGF